MSRHRKLTTICAAVVLSLGLAACGGGGGGSPQTDGNNAANEAKALADAQKAAMTAAGAADMAAKDARQKATDARAAANTLKELAPNTGSATEADTAATNAETAATAAETAATAAATANTAAQAAKTSSVAKGHQADAEKAQKTAEGAQDTAGTGYQTAMSALNAVEGPMITAARTAASKAAKEAKAAYEAARQSATDARAKATAARTAANQAKDARTGYAEADTQATAAETAATNAEEARDAAKTAWDNAEAAVDAADDATTAKDARAQADIAEDERDEAVKQKGTASTEYDTADTAAGKATTASSTHDLGLLMAANAYDVKDVASTPKVDEQAEEVKKVAAAIAAAAGSSSDGDNDSTTATGGGDKTVTASWQGNTPDNPATTNTDETVTRVLTVTLNNLGTVITSDTKGTDGNNDDDTADPGEGPNASMIAGLTGFTHGFDISAHPANSNDPDGRHVIVFTDKKQGKDQTYAKNSDAFGNRPLVLSRLKVNEGVTLTGTLDDLDGKATYDHDGNPDTTAISVTMACSTGDANDCRVEYTGTTVHGFTGGGSVLISATAQQIVAAADATQDATYLAFGVWLQEDSDTGTDGLQPAVGAVAGGGDPVENDIQAVTGTATYKGAATGVYTQGSSVDYFHADATLTADFGKKPTSGADTVNGTVKGVIDNIMAGGMATGDVIKLSGPVANTAIKEAADITDTATFSGMAHMGDGKMVNNITTYTYKGSWSGSFYNPAMMEDTDNPGQMVDDLTKAPGSAAGTFGVTGTDNMGTTTGANATDDDVTTSYVGAFGAHKQ